MTVRERHGLTENALNSVLHNTAQPYRLIYADVQSPDWLRSRLASYAERWGFEVVRYDEHLWPQQVRTRLIDAIDTEYVVYIDNDVSVEPGWLTRLIDCADETGAGVVGPLYLWGDGKTKSKIHMAGGTLTRSVVEGGIVLKGEHHLIDADPKEVRDELFRRPCDFAEYHCMLVRTELVRNGAFLDEDIYCVHEHIDTALSSGQRGYPVYLEPSSRVHYFAFSEYMLDDLPIFRERWTVSDSEASIDAFARKWNVVKDDRSFGGVRTFLHKHIAQVDPIRRYVSMDSKRNTPMRYEELKQNRSDLLDLAAERGYSAQAIKFLANAYRTAFMLVDGGYRPCGRPFINHLVGTASVLLRYGFRMDIVAAGILHAVYDHCPVHAAGTKSAIDAVCVLLGGENSPLEKIVRAYTLRKSSWKNLFSQAEPLSRLTVLDAEIIAIAAANELEMHMSGEFRYSGRADALSSQMMQLISHVCRILGVAGLYDSLVAVKQQKLPVQPDLVTGLSVSYRIANDRVNLVRMTSNATSLLAGASK